MWWVAVRDALSNTVPWKDDASHLQNFKCPSNHVVKGEKKFNNIEYIQILACQHVINIKISLYFIWTSHTWLRAIVLGCASLECY